MPIPYLQAPRSKGDQQDRSHHVTVDSHYMVDHARRVFDEVVAIHDDVCHGANSRDRVERVQSAYANISSQSAYACLHEGPRTKLTCFR